MSEGQAEAVAVPPAGAKRALIIDDYYARPTAGEIRGYTNTLRQFITDNAESGFKVWLDATFGLSGDHTLADYFDPLLANPASIQRFWTMRDESPVGNRISTEVFAALVGELYPAQAALGNIGAQLQSEGWVVRPVAAIPSVDSVEHDIQLIAIDYILIPGQAAQGLERSKAFLREVLTQSRMSEAKSCPFVVLMSENPDAAANAESFRKDVKVHSAYFRFVKKADLSKQEVSRIIGGHLAHRDELESYRRLHVELEAAVENAAKSLKQSVSELEIQDLATLHAGQLAQEGELLSDYVGWLYGQHLTAEMIRHTVLADCAANLPTSSHRVLLGHLSATDNIPTLFSSVSLTLPASALKHKATNGELQIRFGDLFAYRAPPPAAKEVHAPVAAAEAAPTAQPQVQRYLVVISQTCDLVHGDIKNGQVLCLDGDAHTLTRTEVDLLRATIRQMDQQGRSLHKEGSKYIEVEWSKKDLRTVEREKLASENGYRYLGRLNELYALQAQHQALDMLGRIGVPVQPSYSVYFGKLTLKMFEGPTEIAALTTSSRSDMVVAVLRNEKTAGPKARHRLLFSDEIRSWLMGKLQEAANAVAVPDQLKVHVNWLKQSLEQGKDYSLIVKVSKGTIAKFAREKLAADGSVDTAADPKELGGSIAVVLKDVFDAPVAENTRLELTFEKV